MEQLSIGRIFKGDRVVWMVLMLLSLMSLLIVYSATGALAYRVASGNTFKYLLRQVGFLSGGIGVILLMVNVFPIKLYSKIALWAVWASIAFLFFSIVMRGTQFVSTSGRTLNFFGLTFQPAELAKIALIMYTAKVLGKRQKTKGDLWDAFKRIILFTALICGFIFISDFSTSALLFATIMTMMFAGRIPLKYLFSVVGAGIALIVVVYFTADMLPSSLGRVQTMKGRIERFIDPPAPEALQGITQADYAKLAIYSGGIFGKGPGHSDVSNYMAAAYNDFIFAIIVEEYGLIGGGVIMLLFLMFFYRGVVIVRRATRTFPAFLVIGLTLVLVFQAMINIGVSSGALPVTGQPLPWISLGGTSLLFTSVAFGLILSVSHQNQKNREVEAQPLMIKAPDEDYEIEMKNRINKVILSGGGTGGHIFPALAIANEIKKRNPDVDILFVGALGRMEMEKIPAAGYKIIGLPVMGFPRKPSLKIFTFFQKLMESSSMAKKIVKDFQPEIAIGVGGYASGPLLRAAAKKKIPSLIQEQNSYAGITNKLLSKKVNSICVAYDKMDKFFPADKIIFTGNPVRANLIENVDKNEALEYFSLNENEKVILIVGGSLGARSVNNAVLKNIKAIAESDIKVIWQTGAIYYDRIQNELKDTKPENLQIHKFITRMDLACEVADLVISRAGAGTISELCLVGKASILVPSPNVSEDHQTKNAMALVEKDAALMVRDNEIDEKLFPLAFEVVGDEKRCLSFSEKIKELAKPDATKTIVDEVEKLI